MQPRVFITVLIACSTCFGHHYAHHQELKSIIQWLLPVVFRAVVIYSLPHLQHKLFLEQSVPYIKKKGLSICIDILIWGNKNVLKLFYIFTHLPFRNEKCR